LALPEIVDPQDLQEVKELPVPLERRVAGPQAQPATQELPVESVQREAKATPGQPEFKEPQAAPVD
jgi:hypothetical protein